MDSLPLELHAQIFQLACTDDGSTARALSQVSHYVRHVAAPYLYQSLAISGMDQMHELLTRLDATPAHLRPIRHLFLSDWTYADTRKSIMSLTDMERYDVEKALVARVLDLAAPTLETLALVVSCPYTGPPLIGQLFSTPLPHLAELAIHGFYPFPRVPGTMPRLERLHLSGNRNPHGLLQLGALDAASPSLTHLRVSDVSLALTFARELHAAALPPSAQDVSSSPFRSALPRLLKHLRVEVSAGVQLRPWTKNLQAKTLATLRELEVRKGDTCLDTFAVSEYDGRDTYAVFRGTWMENLKEMRVEW